MNAPATTLIHSVAVDRTPSLPTKCSSPMPRCQVMLWCAVGALLRNQR